MDFVVYIIRNICIEIDTSAIDLGISGTGIREHSRFGILAVVTVYLLSFRDEL